jgi:hypothetical protein
MIGHTVNRLRGKFRVAVANSDSGAFACTHGAIDEAYHAAHGPSAPSSGSRPAGYGHRQPTEANA